MASGNGAVKNNSRLSPSEQKDIKCAAEFADNYAKKMKNLEAKFEKMGTLKLFWDSKVPEKKKSFLNRVSFKCSDKEEVVNEIKKYLDFYEAMCSAMGKINGEVEKTELEASDPLLIVTELKTLLTEMDKAAELGLPSTDSSAVFRMHSEFIEKHTQLESLVNRAECICSRDKIKSLNNLLDNCQKTILGFQIGLQEFRIIKEGMEKQIMELVTENEKQRQHQQSLIAVNTKLREDQQNLLGQYNGVCNRLESIETLLVKLTEKKE